MNLTGLLQPLGPTIALVGTHTLSVLTNLDISVIVSQSISRSFINSSKSICPSSANCPSLSSANCPSLICSSFSSTCPLSLSSVRLFISSSWSNWLLLINNTSSDDVILQSRCVGDLFDVLTTALHGPDDKLLLLTVLPLLVIVHVGIGLMVSLSRVSWNNLLGACREIQMYSTCIVITKMQRPENCTMQLHIHIHTMQLHIHTCTCICTVEPPSKGHLG